MIVNYATSNAYTVKQPVYIFRNYAMRYYFDSKYKTELLDFDKANDAAQVNTVINGGTVIFVDFPHLSESSLLWTSLNANCVKNYGVTDKGVKMGYVFTC
jgi:hypothetical protein